MEQLQKPAPDPTRRSDGITSRRDYRPDLGTREIQAYHLADDASGFLILAMLMAGPWAFGTTQPWAIQCMNGVAYTTGLLLLFKLFMRHVRGYHAPRWDNYSPSSGNFSRHQSSGVRSLNHILAWLTFAILAECLVSAWNAAANYTPETRVFHYRPHLGWLPHSFDATSTWSCFWQSLALAAAFWAISDWLGGVNSTGGGSLARQAPPHGLPPARLQTLIWALAINGALLGLEGIIQRESGTNRLLFLLEPRLNLGGDTEFGPYAYRSNAAQYFNLLWPLCLGFWWILHRQVTARNKSHNWLLVCCTIMAACPIISTSRGGALISIGMLLLVTIYLGLIWAKSPAFITTGSPSLPAPMAGATAATVQPDHPGGARPAHFQARKSSQVSRRNGSPANMMLAFVTITLVLGGYFGWNSLEPRMEQIEGGYEGRDAMRKSAVPMTQDYPLFGTGPGTFATVFQLYRYSEAVNWEAQVYDDWLETRITFGWLGFGLLLAAIPICTLRGLFPGGMRGLSHFGFFAMVSLGGCLVHARFDIPFQIHSILFVFLTICAILFNLGRPSGSSGK